MKKVLCIGHASYDITLPMQQFPTENTKVRTEKSVACGGGPASNAAYLLAKWKMDTAFAGVVGNDLYGKRIEEEFQKIGVDLSCFEKSDTGSTTVSYIIANTSKGTRTILTTKDENLAYSKQCLSFQSDVILVDGEELEASLDALRQNPEALSVLDAGHVRDSTIQLGKKVTYLICSKDFAEEYSKISLHKNDIESLMKAYDCLQRDFQTNIVITLESVGCFTKLDDYEILPSISVKAVDSTGAGDIFHGAFTYFIANGYSLRESLLLANIAGAISVTRLGGRYSMPELAEVLEIGKKYAILPQ